MASGVDAWQEFQTGAQVFPLPGFTRPAPTEPAKTALYDLHVSLGGRMVDFADYLLPVQYKDGTIKSHLHTRAAGCASLFDVGHMGQALWYGKDRIKFLESVLVTDIAEMKAGEAKLTLLTSATGGILDDTIITAYPDFIHMVFNGACKWTDLAHYERQLAAFRAKNPGADVGYKFLHTQNLVALQGPGSSAVLSRLVAPADAEAVTTMRFMTGRVMPVMGVQGCIVTRCGYTGEDGYEISIPAAAAVKIATAMVESKEVLPAGLGARDSLRLEAGLCLYGHDLSTSTSPAAGVVAWTIGKRRRAEGGFLGADAILKELKEKSTPAKRVGFIVHGAPAREHYPIYLPNTNGSDDPKTATKIGEVTSGAFSPCLKVPIGMGYVPTKYADLGTKLAVEVRGKLVPATVSKMPFVPQSYYKPA